MENGMWNWFLEQELENYLDDNCRQFYHCVLSDTQLIIYVSGYLGDLDKEELKTDVEAQFPDLKGRVITIMDAEDRQKRTDTERRHLETEIRDQVAKLVNSTSSPIGVNDVYDVWLRFTIPSRIGRWLGHDPDGIVMKVATDPEKRWEVEKALIPLAEKHQLPLRVIGATSLRQARDELRRLSRK